MSGSASGRTTRSWKALVATLSLIGRSNSRIASRPSTRGGKPGGAKGKSSTASSVCTPTIRSKSFCTIASRNSSTVARCTSLIAAPLSCHDPHGPPAEAPVAVVHPHELVLVDDARHDPRLLAALHDHRVATSLDVVVALLGQHRTHPVAAQRGAGRLRRGARELGEGLGA